MVLCHVVIVRVRTFVLLELGLCLLSGALESDFLYELLSAQELLVKFNAIVVYIYRLLRFDKRLKFGLLARHKLHFSQPFVDLTDALSDTLG